MNNQWGVIEFELQYVSFLRVFCTLDDLCVSQEGRRWEDGRLIQEAPVPISTLILGGSVRITTPLGKRIQIGVPERTKIGDRRRVQGHGHQGGDLDIEFVLQETEKLTKKQKDILDQIRESGP